MAKETKKAVAQEEEMTGEALLGNMDASALAALGLEEVDPLKGLDATFNAGQEGFEKGITKVGIYKGVKVCVSTAEKKPNWKAHPDAELAAKGKVVRRMYIFQAVSASGEVLKKYFGIWHAGTLGAILKRVKPEQLLAVTYTGVAEKAFKPGQSKPHTFRVMGKGLELSIADLDDLEGVEDDAADLTPEQVASLNQFRAQHVAAPVGATA